MEERKARWYGGCAPGSRPTAIPVGTRLIWSDPTLWVFGVWEAKHVRTVELGNARIAVLGPCSASEHDLARALSCPDLATVASSWAGSHTVVRTGVRGFVEVLADTAGASPLYTVNTPGGVVWGSSALALSPLVGGSVDPEWLAAYLRDKHTPAPGRSAWSGVTPVPAGHLLTLDAEGGTSLAPWWKPAKRTPDEVSAALRHALGEGVRVRVGGAPATTDLAGMDSTTVAVLAAQYGPITGVTLHPTGVTNGGDMEYARALNVPGLRHTFFPLGVHHLPFTATDFALPVTDAPAPSTSVWSMFSEQLRMMAAAGSVCHLTGDGGDNLFLPTPTHLASLARRGHWLRMLGDAMDWARLRRQSPRPLIAAALRGNAAHIGRSVRPRPPWLNVSVPNVNTPTGTDPDTAFVASLRNAARSAYAEIQLADAFGLALHNPYFDGAVLDAVISAPVEQRYSAHRYKPLLADTFADLMPEAHRKRAAKGVFVGDFHHGLRVNLRRVLRLADGRLASLGLINPAPLRATIHAAALGAQTVWPPLLAALASEAWLEAVERAPGTEWEERAPAPAGVR
ncbi:asparagine synthase [Streptomyces sp. AV19]|uniref:albusnodin/ikarugamycin family macrolactam cyclase n=1 Tax=Streptomyces sp. AV19 TaxID=2793068 RepID=UPI0018FE5D4B|nr:albusnodin/ikarugamycin family macrolactam cyclase [Streptomyces sp. AV19]MBH1936477.1 asparagine synthase [Streptomyces sp. AV19]MDG4532533.1 albusnodin/ikarugamycin family macrolactam cyclase [Streptomyces sp. AV19]